MINNRPTFGLNLVLLLGLLTLPVSAWSQTTPDNKLQAKTNVKETSVVSDADQAQAQRRIFAISLVTSLADEARSYHDLALRPRVLARAADALWNADRDAALVLFRRAWEAAEKGDAEDLTLKNQDGVPRVAVAMVTALRRSSGSDLRSEVINFAARRDRALGEEFLKKLKDDVQAESAGSRDDRRSRNPNDSWSVSEAVSKRFHLARKLLADGEIDRALEFAAPVLNQVNSNSIAFLSLLREIRPEVADQRFAYLIGQVEFDPSADANTVSGLSSYIFTPGFYWTFNPEGGARWTQPEDSTGRLNPPLVSGALRARFLQAAAAILLRPSPPPDQDFTTSGRTGKYMVIKRLLPLFDQYAPDSAAALRSQLTTLAGDPNTQPMGKDSALLTQGLQPAEVTDNAFEKMQDRLDHAKTTPERDSIYADAAAALANQGDARAQDLADKIDNPDRRAQVRRYVDFELVRFAIRKKEGLEAGRLAKAGQLTHVQRAWSYAQVARLLKDSESPRALQFLEEAADEARRISADDPDRARAFIAVATQFVIADRVRAWEIMNEAVKAANSADKFNGENLGLVSAIATKSGLKISSVGGEDFGLAGILRSLARDDLCRSIDFAKGFKKDAPRATAILAIANTVLEK